MSDKKPAATRMCFYSKEQLVTVDTARNIGGEWRSSIFGETLEQVRLRYPDAVLVSIYAAAAEIEAAVITGPERTTEEVYHEMLNILPPLGWAHPGSSCSSFKMSEMLRGRLTSIYIRRGDEYWHMINRVDLTHDQIMAMLPPRE